MEKKDKLKNFYLTERQCEWLNKLASDNDLSEAQFIRDMITKETWKQIIQTAAIMTWRRLMAPYNPGGKDTDYRYFSTDRAVLLWELKRDEDPSFGEKISTEIEGTYKQELMSTCDYFGFDYELVKTMDQNLPEGLMDPRKLVRKD